MATELGNAIMAELQNMITSQVAETQPVTSTSKPIADYKEMLESWKIDLIGNDLSDATRNSYTIHVEAFFVYHGNVNLHSVKVGDVIYYRNHLQKAGLRPATINLKRVSLNRFFQFLR